MPGITRSVATAISGMAALYHGDLAAALDQLGAAVADFGEHGTDDHKSYDDNGMSYQFLILHTEALARTGEVDSARSALALMQRCRPPGWDYLESDNLLATAWVAAADGDPARAAALAHQAAGYAREHEQHAREVLCLQTALQFGDVGPVLSGRLAELAALVEGPRAPLVACWARARECRDGDALAKVSEHLEEMGDRVAAADAAAHASLALTSAGRAGEALAACNRATRIAAAARAVTPAARDISGSVVLSRRELDI